MQIPPCRFKRLSDDADKQPRALDNHVLFELMAAPIRLLLDGPDVLHDDVEGASGPHKDSLVQIDKLIGADDVRVPQPCGESMNLIRDLIALGWRDARDERAMAGQLRLRLGGCVDGFISDHMRIAFDQGDMFV